MTASEGESQTFDVTATSVFDSNVLDTATNTTNVDEDAVVNVQKNVNTSQAAVSDTLTYTFSYAESGGSSNATNLEIKDPLPAGLTYVPGSGVWSGASGIPLTDASPGETASGITYEFDNSGAVDSVLIRIASINAGASGNVSFKVVVNAGQEGNTITNSGTFSTMMLQLQTQPTMRRLKLMKTSTLSVLVQIQFQLLQLSRDRS